MEFIAQVEKLPAMLGFITDAAQSAGVKGEKLGKIELASEEALVNIIYHAYPEREAEENSLHISCDAKIKGRFQVTFRDKGIPFNPCEKKVNLQTDIPLEERAVGGLGIYLIRQLVDEMKYERSSEENVLSLSFVL